MRFDKYEQAQATAELWTVVRRMIGDLAHLRGTYGTSFFVSRLANAQDEIDKAVADVRACEAKVAVEIDGPPAEDAWLYDAMKGGE